MTIRVDRRVLVAVPVVLTLLAVAWFVLARSGPVDDRSVELPATFLGLEASTVSDVAASAGISEDLGGAGTAVRTYGGPGTTILNVVATRTDMTDKVDLQFLGDEGRPIGGARCTTNVVLRQPGEGSDSPGSPMAGKLLCWRTSDALSVSAFVLSRPGAEEDVAAAVDALFASLG